MSSAPCLIHLMGALRARVLEGATNGSSFSSDSGISVLLWVMLEDPG
jgi:hypothetical protein